MVKWYHVRDILRVLGLKGRRAIRSSLALVWRGIFCLALLPRSFVSTLWPISWEVVHHVDRLQLHERLHLQSTHRKWLQQGIHDIIIPLIWHTYYKKSVCICEKHMLQQNHVHSFFAKRTHYYRNATGHLFAVTSYKRHDRHQQN